MSETTYLDKVEEQYRDHLDLDGPVPNPDPQIFSITPSSYTAEPEDEDLTITVTGDGFTGTTSVTLDGVAGTGLDVNSNNELEITFALPEDDGSFDVVVHEGAKSSNAAPLVLVLTPAITSITPSSFEAEPEDESLAITVAGSGFTGSTSVTLDGVEATEMTVNSAAEIEAVFPVPEEAGSLDVVVHKGDLDSNAVALTFTIAD